MLPTGCGATRGATGWPEAAGCPEAAVAETMPAMTRAQACFIQEGTPVDFCGKAMLSKCLLLADPYLMSLLPFCEWLGATPGSIALHESLFMYPLIESTHVLTLCLFVGMTLVLDLRLTGLALRRVPVTDIVTRLQPLMFFGFFVMVVTGVLLFYAIPIRSYQSIFFRIKSVFLILAGLNAWAFHTGVFRNVSAWGRDVEPPLRARRAGIASLVLWAGVIITGRMIAYNWFDCDKPQPRWVQVATGCTYDAQR